MSMETIFFEKEERYFPAKKSLRPIFSRIIQYEKLQATNFDG